MLLEGRRRGWRRRRRGRRRGRGWRRRQGYRVCAGGFSEPPPPQPATETSAIRDSARDATREPKLLADLYINILFSLCGVGTTFFPHTPVGAIQREPLSIVTILYKTFLSSPLIASTKKYIYTLEFSAVEPFPKHISLDRFSPRLFRELACVFLQ